MKQFENSSTKRLLVKTNQINNTLQGPYPIFCRGHSGGRLVCEAFIRNNINMGRVTADTKDSEFFDANNPLIREIVLNAYHYLQADSTQKKYYQQLMHRCINHYQRTEIQHDGPFGWKLGVSLFTMQVVLDAFPTAKVIHLVRDGRDVMLSRLKARLDNLGDPINRLVVFGDTNVTHYKGHLLSPKTVATYRNELEMLHWVTAVSYGLKGRAYTDRYLEVKYEDICQDPMPVFTQIFDFIEVPFLESTKHWLTQTVYTGKMAKWQKLSAEKLKEPLQIAEPLLKDLGYIKTNIPLKENDKTTNKASSYCFVFICQQDELEIKSMLLAASLKRYLPGEYEYVVAIPQLATRWRTISSETQAFMQTLGIRLVPITNLVDDNYPIGNKVACLGIDTSADKLVFLDSDILCLREFWFDNQSPFSAKPADLPTFTKNIAVWQQVYDLFQLPLPDKRVISSVSGELMLPYFNSGVIVVQNGLGLAKVWAECCRKIDAETSITNKRPWLEQSALPVAVAKLNLAYECLDERFNYPAHLKPLPKSPHPPLSKGETDSLPFLCHYHSLPVLRREPQLNQLVTELAEAYPILKNRLLESPEWAQLLKPSKPPRFSKPWRFQPEPEAIITGISRSGTSYLCRLLHTLPDCVVINEPTQIFAPLANELRPWRIATFYQELRRDILDGQPVENKLHNGQLIEDTAIIDTLTRYQPQVSRADFLLCTKNTLAYLARLPQLKQVMPHAPIIACVRNPLDTIASWKSTFTHLKHATVTDFPVGHINDPFLSAWQRDRLAEIAATPKN